MEARASSPKAGGLSPSECVNDPDEKEISDDNDDDRNHKHRRWETPSESVERDALEQVLIRPYRKRNKPFDNGHPYRENNSHSSETRKNYNRAPSKVNQSLSAELGFGRGGGREYGSWSQRGPRFSSVVMTSQLFPRGYVPPSLFGGRGLPNVSSSHNEHWSAFGLVPVVSNGGLDALHSLGLQGTVRPSIGPSLNIGIPPQRCRDLEECGICLRGEVSEGTWCQSDCC